MTKLVKLQTNDKVTLRKHYEKLCREVDISHGHSYKNAKGWLDFDQIQPKVIYTIDRCDSVVISLNGKRYFHRRVLFKKVVMPPKHTKIFKHTQQASAATNPSVISN